MIKNPFLRKMISPFVGAALRAWSPMTLAELDTAMDEAISGRQTLSGISVNKDTAMNFAAFYNGVMQISQTVASLPLIFYKRMDDSRKRRFVEHPIYSLLHDKANSYLPAFYWRECSTNHQIIAGNSYSYIERDGGYRPIGLWLRNPFAMDILGDDPNRFYEFTRSDGTKKIYRYDEILHIPGFGFDGRKGYPILTLARESIALGLSFEQYHARFMGRGAHISGILQTEKTLGQKGRDNLQQGFKKAYTGLGNTGEIPVLEEGVKFEKIGMSLVDAEFLSSRVFSIQEMARWLNMPPHKLKEQTNSTYSNVESENLSFYQDTIRPYLVRQEAFINFKLAPDSNSYAEYLFDAILRADILTRMKAYQVERYMGTLNADEIRAYENRDAIKDGGGEIYLVPSNMTTIDKIVSGMVDPAQADAAQMEQDKKAEVDTAISDQKKEENKNVPRK